MHQLHYLIGDATEPVKTPALIAHVCNDVGRWGRGFVVAVSAKWPIVEKRYREAFRTSTMELGTTQFVETSGVNRDVLNTSKAIIVANMVSQRDTQWVGKVPPIRYDALETCLRAVYAKAETFGWTVHMPRIGCVLAGGDWGYISQLILKTMTVETFVYTLEKQKTRWKDAYENA